MHRVSESEWRRKKEYLMPSMFTDPVLSPIPEHRESDRPTERVVRENSPLPDLIVEKQRRYEYEDETEEFYDRLEIKMKRFYRKIFLGEDIDIEVSDQSVPDYSNDEAGVDDIEGDDGVRDGPDDKDDEDSTVLTEEEVESEESPDAVRSSNSGNGSGKLQESREGTDVTDSEVSHQSLTTSPESAEKSEAAHEKLINILGKIYSLSSSDDASNKADNVRILPSQTYTEKPDQLEDSPGVRTKTASESSGAMAETITEQALVHTEEQRQLELIRRQTMHLLEDSFRQPSETSKDDRVDLNVKQYSLEELSTINTSVSLEIDSFVNPTRICTPIQEASPVMRWKRPSTNVLHHIAAKKKKTDSQEIAEKSHKEIETGQKNQKDVATETEVNADDKEVQVNIPKPLTVANAEIQTVQETGEACTEMSIAQADVGIQTDKDPEWIVCRSTATQTEERETRDEETQTQRSFECYRLFDEVNFFFIF